MSSRMTAAYTAWRNEPIPRGSSRDDIDELHAEIVTIDMWVADLVVPYVEHAERFADRVDVQGAIDRGLERVTDLRTTGTQGDRDLLDSYQRYLHLLSEAFQAFQAET